MAKNRDAVDINKNFELLKAQMKKKRELAENIAEEIEAEPKQQVYEMPTQAEEPKEEFIEEEPQFEDNYDYQDTEETEDLEEKKGVEYTAKSGVVSDININRIVIKKIEKPELPKRITYYLRPDTIKKIDKFSRLAGMGKSEFVQKILDEVLNNLEIEK